MKAEKISAWLLAILTVTTCNSWSRPVDLSAPTGSVGMASSQGYLQIWNAVAQVGIQLGKGSYLPLRYEFTSEPNRNGILGPGFFVPMFESRNILIREQMMRVFLPCGKDLYLRRDPVDESKFQTVDKEWTGALDGDNFQISRSDGWTLRYEKGRLASLTNDANHTFSWTYADGSINISENGRSLIQTELDSNGRAVAFVFNEKRYEVGYAQRPITQVIKGQTLIKSLDQALSTFRQPDGTTKIFEFATTQDLVPTLSFTNAGKQPTLYTWNAANGHLATEDGPDGKWTYKVGAVTEAFGRPPISMTNSEGKTESLSLDREHGIYTARHLDGTTTVTYVFTAPGPLYEKVKSVENINGKVTKLVYQASYDEAGRLVRKLDDRGFITTYSYDLTGHFIGGKMSLSTDPSLLAALAAEEKIRLHNLETAKSPMDRENILRGLYLFYICKNFDYTKAAALMPMLSNPANIYGLKLLLALNPNQSVDQRNQMLEKLDEEFPDKKFFTDKLITKSTPQ